MRLSALPPPLLHHLHARCASTTSSLFPFPVHPRPTPHQIFHLPPSASQEDIKARYYDLVRTHHPDAAACRALAPAERHARFQAVVAAYDVLRGNASPDPDDIYANELRRRARTFSAHARRHAAYTAERRAQAQWAAAPDDRWKDRVLVVVGLVTIAAGLAPGLFILPWHIEQTHRAAATNLAVAHGEAADFGAERRREVRRRVREHRALLLLQEEEARRGGLRRDDELESSDKPKGP